MTVILQPDIESIDDGVDLGFLGAVEPAGERRIRCGPVQFRYDISESPKVLAVVSKISSDILLNASAEKVEADSK